MPEAGAYSHLNRPPDGRPIPTHLAEHEAPDAIVLLRVAAAIATVTVVVAVALALWLAPWPVDAVTAFAAAAAWTSWVERQEQKGP